MGLRHQQVAVAAAVAAAMLLVPAVARADDCDLTLAVVATDSESQKACRAYVADFIATQAAGAVAQTGTCNPQLEALRESTDPCDAAASQLVQLVADRTLGGDQTELEKREVEAAAAAVVEAMPLDAVQPAPTDTPGAQGSAGQTSAAPSAKPVATAGGTLAYAARDGGGQDLVAAVSLNPLATPEDDTRSYAWKSRFVDASLILPAGLDATTATSKDAFRYVGVRLRVNVLAKRQGSDIYDKAVAEVKAFVGKQEDLTSEIHDLLVAAPDAAACLAALAENLGRSTNSGDVKSVCGGEPFEVDPSEEYRALADKLEAIRDEADRSYIALDLRGDFGDPTTADDEDSRGTYVSAALAAGRRFTDTFSARGAVGFRYFKLKHPVAMADPDRHSVHLPGGPGWEPPEQVRAPRRPHWPDPPTPGPLARSCRHTVRAPGLSRGGPPGPGPRLARPGLRRLGQRRSRHGRPRRDRLPGPPHRHLGPTRRWQGSLGVALQPARRRRPWPCPDHRRRLVIARRPRREVAVP